MIRHPETRKHGNMLVEGAAVTSITTVIAVFAMKFIHGIMDERVQHVLGNISIPINL